MNTTPSVTRPIKIMVATATTLLVMGLVWSVKHPNSNQANSNQNSHDQQTPQRSPASHNSDPNKKAKQTSGNQHIDMGKTTAGLSIQISGKNSNGEVLASVDNATYDLVNSRFTLTGKIVANRHMAAQDFNWIFPQTYKVIEGGATGTIPELHPGEEHSISITLDRGLEPEQPVVLHVFKIVNSEPRGTIVQYDFPPRVETDSRTPTSELSHGSVDHRGEKFVQ